MVTRRGFLAAGAAFGIGGLAFGRSCVRQIAAGAKIRVALIGCGGRLQQLVEPIMAERIVALVDPDPRMRAATRERMVQVGWRDALAGVREFFDYRELYAKMGDALDAVFIATPNHHHALAAVLAMRRGIHVFVEKPMASTVAEAQEIRKAKNFSYKTTEHTHEFYAAIRESRPANTGFDYSVPLAETLLLANVAARAGKGAVLKWDGRSITNNPAANAFLSAPCRPGWELG